MGLDKAFVAKAGRRPIIWVLNHNLCERGCPLTSHRTIAP